MKKQTKIIANLLIWLILITLVVLDAVPCSGSEASCGASVVSMMLINALLLPFILYFVGYCLKDNFLYHEKRVRNYIVLALLYLFLIVTLPLLTRGVVAPTIQEELVSVCKDYILKDTLFFFGGIVVRFFLDNYKK